MLKLGKMYTAKDEYNIFILKNESIDRLEIGTSTSKWHSIDSKILYGEYTRKAHKTYGRISLGNLYKDTIRKAKTIAAPEQMDLRLEDGIFYKDFLKYLSDKEYYGFTEKSGKLDSEVCLHSGVKIVMCVSDANCCLDLEPLNFLEYKRSKKQSETPELNWPRACNPTYENYLFMTAVFRKMFKCSVSADINIDSQEELRALLYDKMGMPVLIREQNGRASVGTDAIYRLARKKRDSPAIIITSDIKDNKGRLALKADRLNNAKYPAAIFLEKYRHYKELAESFYDI